MVRFEKQFMKKDTEIIFHGQNESVTETPI